MAGMRASNPRGHALAAVRAARLARLEQTSRPVSQQREGSDRAPSSRRIEQMLRIQHAADDATPSSASPHAPPRYMPGAAGDEPSAGADRSDRVLNQSEQIELRDGRGKWQLATALLDTGNELMTCIDTSFAQVLGLYDSSSSIFAPQEHVTLRGIVPGATATAPVVTATLRMRGFEFKSLRVALTELGANRPVLLGMDVLERLFASGLSISRA